MNISFIGLGKLGLCSAACFASKGHHVTGVDSNQEFIAALRQRRCPIDETGLDSLLQSAWENLSVTDDYAHAVAESDATFIIVPTPSQQDGQFSNTYVEKVLEQLAPALAAKKSFHIVNIVSTVMPGSGETVFRPLLEHLTGKKCGQDFGLAYNPEFIALGSVIQNFLNPDMVLIGSSDERTALTLQEAYSNTVDSKPHFAHMNLTNAEITKLSLNCFVTMKISFANELTALCENIPGANVDVVTQALGHDTRIGRKYLTGGLGFGGPCFPRDNKAFQAVGRQFGYTLQLGPQVVAVNEAVVDRLFAYIHAGFEKKGQPVALFGVSYKQDTQITEASQGILLAHKLVEAGYAVRLHDPKALAEARKELGNSVAYCDDPHAAVKDATAIVLLANWPQFASYDWEALEKEARQGAVLLDSWRILLQRHFTQCSYRPLGICL